MNKYRDKSDFEINKAVAECLKSIDYIDNYISHNGAVCIADSYGTSVTFDPCNNPVDAMPIFIENKMGAMFLGDLVQITNFSGTIANFGRNFYRTIAELFLMMKEAENEN